MNIIDICKEQKQKLGYSYEKIATEAGIPISTVASFFRDSAKSPATRTAGPICRVLSVSLDAYYEIYVPGMDLHEINRIKMEHEALMEKYRQNKIDAEQAQRDSLAAGEYIEEVEKLAQMERQRAESARKTIHGLRNLAYGLTAVCVLLAASNLVLLLS